MDSASNITPFNIIIYRWRYILQCVGSKYTQLLMPVGSADAKPEKKRDLTVRMSQHVIMEVATRS
jgi:hypothetical protein